MQCLRPLPAVLLLEPVVQAMPAADRETAWLALAMSSTFAGNFTILGSVANLIVVETARREGVAVSFWEYCRGGIPLTLCHLGGRRGLADLAAVLAAGGSRPAPPAATCKSRLEPLQSPHGKAEHALGLGIRGTAELRAVVHRVRAGRRQSFAMVSCGAGGAGRPGQRRATRRRPRGLVAHDVVHARRAISAATVAIAASSICTHDQTPCPWSMMGICRCRACSPHAPRASTRCQGQRRIHIAGPRPPTGPRPTGLPVPRSCRALNDTPGVASGAVPTDSSARPGPGARKNPLDCCK